MASFFVRALSAFFLSVFWLFIAYDAESADSAARPQIIVEEQQPAELSLPSFFTHLLYHPDFIELPLVLSKDDVAVCSNTLILPADSNAAALFPEKKREDGKFYFIDFTWSELQQISLMSTQGTLQTTAHFFSLADAASLTKEINAICKKKTQLVPAILYPQFHNREGKDISTLIIKEAVSLLAPDAPSLPLMCYDPDELQRIHDSLIVGLPVAITLWQGTAVNDPAEPYAYELLSSHAGMRQLSTVAQVFCLTRKDLIPPENLQVFIDNLHTLHLQIFLSADMNMKKNTDTAASSAFSSPYDADGISVDPLHLRKFFSSPGTQPPLIKENSEEPQGTPRNPATIPVPQPTPEKESVPQNPDTAASIF